LRPFATRRPIEFDFDRLLRLRSRVAEKRARGISTRSTPLRSSSIPRPASSIAAHTPTEPPIQTDLAHPRTPSQSRSASRSAGPGAGSAAREADRLIAAVVPADRGLTVQPAHLIFDDGTDLWLVRSGYSMGRASENDFRFDNADLSSRHCQLSFDGQRWWVSDLGSKNGVRVNGQLALDHPLRSGDRIKLAGSVSFRIEYGPKRRRLRLLMTVLAVLAGFGVLEAILYFWLRSS
jgi:predicted component of type VI protein secretion system